MHITSFRLRNIIEAARIPLGQDGSFGPVNSRAIKIPYPRRDEHKSREARRNMTQDHVDRYELPTRCNTCVAINSIVPV